MKPVCLHPEHLAGCTRAELACAAVCTWPGLCVILCQLLRTEVESSKSKKRGGVDTNLPRVLRKFVRLAEEGQRRSGAAAASARLTLS